MDKLIIAAGTVVPTNAVRQIVELARERGREVASVAEVRERFAKLGTRDAR